MIDLSVIQQINQEQQAQDKEVKPVEIKDKDTLFKSSERTGEIINERRAILASDVHIARGEGLNKSGTASSIKTPVLDSLGSFFEIDKEEKKEEKKEEPKAANPWSPWTGTGTTTTAQKTVEMSVDEKFDKYFDNRYKETVTKIKNILIEDEAESKDVWNIFDLHEGATNGLKKADAESSEDISYSLRKVDSRMATLKGVLAAGKGIMKSIEHLSLQDEIEKERERERERAREKERAESGYRRYL